MAPVLNAGGSRVDVVVSAIAGTVPATAMSSATGAAARSFMDPSLGVRGCQRERERTGGASATSGALGGSLLSRLDLRLSVVSVPSATATDGGRAAQSASARDPRLAVAGHLRDPGGQLAGCDVGDGDVLDDVAQALAHSDPHLLQRLGRA